jgi:class 3 adenylate cyclase
VRRRLTTIVAADVVGYSRLLSEDEGATLSALEVLRTQYIGPKAAAYSGRTFRFLGDGTLLEFDSALGAVEFAIDVQRSLSEYNIANPQHIPILLRIGINLGDVVIENGEIHGDGVNIAVRLEALAEPGGICLTDSVYSQIKQRVGSSFISIGSRSLKNIVDPVLVWRWRPAFDVCPSETIGRLEDGSREFKGQHIIDPKLIDVLLRLHARSALLAVSNALDAIADEKSEQIRFDKLYLHFGEQLHQARELLNTIKVERVDNHRELSTSGARQQTMGEFVASTFSDSKIGYAFKIVPEAQAILATSDSFMVKRKRLLELVRRFHNEEFLTRSRALIKYAYID